MANNNLIPGPMLRKMVVKERMKSTMVHIEANPDQWTSKFFALRQNDGKPWHCFVGWYLTLHHDFQWEWLRLSGAYEESECGHWEGQMIFAASLFDDVTGISPETRCAFTQSANTIEDLRFLVDRFVAGLEITPLDEL